MKRNILSIIAAVSFLGAALSGCQKVAHEDLGYEPAGSVTFTQVTDLGKTSEDGLNIFDIELSSSDAKLFLKFYGTDFYLSNASFTPCDTPEKAHYSKADSYYEKGGQKFSIEKGAVAVSSTGNDYTFSGVLWLSSGEKVKISAKGELVYERVVLTYTQAFPPTVTALDGGGYNIQLILGTDGIEQKNMGAWMEYPGTGQYILLELISATEALEPGVYTIAEDTSYGVGNYLAGYGIEVDLSDYGMGIVTSHQHSRIMDVVDGLEILNAYLTAGKVTVKESASGFDIEVDADKQYALFSGPIGGSEEPEPEPEPEPDIKVTGFTDEVSDVTTFDFSVFDFVKVEGVEKHTMSLYQEGEKIAQIQVITAEGGSIEDFPAGYTMSATSNDPGTWVPGWDGTMAGLDGYQGSYVVDDEGTWFLNQEGATLYISPQEDGSYMFVAMGTVSAATPDGSATKDATVFWTLPLIEEEIEGISFTETVSDVNYFDFASFSFVKAEGVEKHTMILSENGSVVAQLAVITAEGGSILDHPDGYVSSSTSQAAGVFYPDWDGSTLGYSAHEGSYVVVDGKEWLLTEEGKTLYISSADGEVYNFYAGVINATSGSDTQSVSVIYQATKVK